ncbi:Transposon TX1 uncharacterized 149 kDa protein ORF 2 [Takifugu flavidus]|uniref:Transposon TX1 uncharacterized 149 kDa protein ORF 2 n=1 Tax=Takifugu flavidus TaxID=433684 RepID=A0A5C6PE51_9TELE|nr:Transposon TX1 uncharacterized 149 kDa protein ORF 2 [Takifugu flavidus]
MDKETHSDRGIEADWEKEWEGQALLSHNTTLSGGVGLLFSRGFTASSLEVEHVVRGRCLLKTRLQNHSLVFINIYAPIIGQELVEPGQIRKRAVEFFSSFYESEYCRDDGLFNEFCGDLPRVSEEANLRLDRPLQLDELHAALLSMKGRKAPGVNGLTVEFFKAFWDIVAHDMLEVFNESLASGSLPLSCRRAVVTLLPKKGNLQEIKNWHPLSLLCMDYRILSKTLASRLREAMEQVIHRDQTYCVPSRPGKGWWMCGGGREFLWKVMERFGFSPGFIAMIRVLYCDTANMLKFNGSLCAPFMVRRGVRQGCVLSGMLYALSLEPLLSKICTNLDGMVLLSFYKKIVLSAYADDIIIVVRRQSEAVGSLLGICSTQAAEGLLRLWKNRLSTRESHLLEDYGQGTKPDSEDIFPEIRLAAHLGNLDGPLLRPAKTFSLCSMNTAVFTVLDQHLFCSGQETVFHAYTLRLTGVQSRVYPASAHCAGIGSSPPATLSGGTSGRKDLNQNQDLEMEVRHHRLLQHVHGAGLLSQVDQLYTFSRVFEGAWEFAQPVHICFVDLEKAFDRVPRGILWGVLREFGVSGPLMWAVHTLYNRCQSLVRIAGSESNSFPVRVGLRQGCPLSPILFVTFMDRISRCSHGVEGVRCGDLRIGSLLFADDVVLLASSARDLQRSLDRFAAACEAAGMRISTSKSEAMVLNWKKVECLLQVKEEILPQVEEFKYLGVLFTSEGRMEREIDRQIGAASAVMRILHRSVDLPVDLRSYPHLWLAGLYLRDRVRSSAIREELGVEPLLLHLERSQMRWLGHLVRMAPGRLPGEVFR